MKRKIILGIILLSLVFILTGCKDSSVNENLVYNTSSKNNTQTEKKEEEENKEVKLVNYEEVAKKQMANPEKGETIATITVKNFGDIKIKFFEKSAPKAVENFVTHAKEGYYDGTIFHRVMEEFMIQGGDPDGNGTGGESIWGKGFNEEIDEELLPYRGALCMASRGTGTYSIGSQFFIVQANYSEQMATTLKYYGYDEKLIESYKNYGGYLSLYGGYTVFGQVFEGMDVVDKIAKVEKDYSLTGELSVPKETITVEKIVISEY